MENTPITTTDNNNNIETVTNKLDTKISNTESSPKITTNQLDTRNSIVVDSDSDNLNNGENSNSESTTINDEQQQSTTTVVVDRVRRSFSDYVHRKYDE